MAEPEDAPGRAPVEGRGIRHTCGLLCHELHADGIGVSVGGGGRTGTAVVHVSDPLGAALEELHFVLGEGPALTCLATGRTVDVPDLDAAAALGRWPGFVPEATRAGAASLLSVPLYVSTEFLGTATFHRRQREALVVTRTVADLAAELAERIVAAFVSAGSPFGPSGAPAHPLPEHRPDVHVAAGMLSVQWGVNTDQALSRLCATAFVEQSTVQQVARDVVHRRRTLSAERDHSDR